MTNTHYDCVVVGAGAAGIAAARTLGAAGLSYVVLETAAYVGGRCVTKQSEAGLPYDLGAHFLHMPELNPLYRLGAEHGFDVYPASDDYWLQRNRREASLSDYDALEAAWARVDAAVFAHPATAADVDCASLMPRDLGRWQQTVEFIVGPYLCGRDLQDVSAHDFVTSDEREIDGLCRQGFGALLARLAEGLKVHLSTRVRHIEALGSSGVRVETDRGELSAKAIVVTVSTSVLAASGITFRPGLPTEVSVALDGLPLGNYERVVMTLGGNAIGAEDDILVLSHATGASNAALIARCGGTDVAMLDVGGQHARDLADAGHDAMEQYAREWLRSTFGGYAVKQLKVLDTTAWSKQPGILGSFSSARPGMMSARATLRNHSEGNIWFAGEATHPSLWGTVSGAWDSGVNAANAVHRTLREQRHV
jgi:monoamine oxidase